MIGTERKLDFGQRRDLAYAQLRVTDAGRSSAMRP